MTDLRTRISVRAYFIAEAAGWPEGQHETHWFAAERAENAVDLGKDHDAHHGAFLYARLGDMSEVDAINGAPERGRDMGAQHIQHVFAFHETLRAKAAKRRAAALKGAATRKANREAHRESESRVVAAILGRSAARDVAVGASPH